MKYKLYFLSLIFLYASLPCSLAQEITTIAGTGVSGYAGDGGKATTATFNWPNAVAEDSLGNLYIADLDNDVVREVNAAGFVTTIAGNSLIGYEGDNYFADIAKLNYPTGVAVDKNGNLYIADQFNHVVRKVTPSGYIFTFAGNGFQASMGPGGYRGDGGPATNAEFYAPESIAFDRIGNLYISDIGNSVVRKVDTSGIITTIVGNGSGTGYSGDGGPASAAKLYQPMGIAVDNAGNLFIADHNNNVIRKVNTAGIISTVAGTGFQVDTTSHIGGYTGDGGQATAAELSLPAGVAVDAAGNLYIADGNNMVVRMVNTAGIISTVAGNGSAGYTGDGGAAKSATLNFPQGVTIDNLGNLLIADYNNNVVRRVNTGSPEGIKRVILNDALQLIPNPNTGTFVIKGATGPNASQAVSLEVMDMTGQIVYKNIITAQNGIINTQINLDEAVPDGVYVLRVNTGTAINVSRFVMER